MVIRTAIAAAFIVLTVLAGLAAAAIKAIDNAMDQYDG